MFKSYVVVPVVLALGLAVAGGAVLAHPVVPEKPATAAEKHELILRAQWGFTRDLETVRRIDGTHARSYLGFPMSGHERAEMRARSRLGGTTGRVSAVVGRDPSFGGLWLINQGSGFIGIGWVGKPSRMIVAAVDAAVDDPSRVRFFRVKHSEKSLLALQQQVFDDLAGARQGLTPFRSSSVDIIHSVVEVTVSTPLAAERLRAKYGRDELIVTVGSGVDFQGAST